MVDKRIIGWINQQRTQRYSDQQIMQTLISQGYPQDEINVAMSGKQQGALNNAWLLSLILLGISLLIGLAGSFISKTSGTISGMLAAWILGNIYSAKFKAIMPKDLRIKTTTIYIITQLIIGLVVLYSMDLMGINIVALAIAGVVIFVSLIEALVIYWSLGSAGKKYIKKEKNLMNGEIKRHNNKNKNLIISISILIIFLFIGYMWYVNKSPNTLNEETEVFVNDETGLLNGMDKDDCLSFKSKGDCLQDTTKCAWDAEKNWCLDLQCKFANIEQCNQEELCDWDEEFNSCYLIRCSSYLEKECVENKFCSWSLIEGTDIYSCFSKCKAYDLDSCIDDSICSWYPNLNNGECSFKFMQ